MDRDLLCVVSSPPIVQGRGWGTGLQGGARSSRRAQCPGIGHGSRRGWGGSQATRPGGRGPGPAQGRAQAAATVLPGDLPILTPLLGGIACTQAVKGEATGRRTCLVLLRMPPGSWRSRSWFSCSRGSAAGGVSRK